MNRSNCSSLTPCSHGGGGSGHLSFLDLLQAECMIDRLSRSFVPPCIAGRQWSISKGLLRSTGLPHQVHIKLSRAMRASIVATLRTPLPIKAFLRWLLALLFSGFALWYWRSFSRFFSGLATTHCFARAWLRSGLSVAHCFARFRAFLVFRASLHVFEQVLAALLRLPGPVSKVFGHSEHCRITGNSFHCLGPFSALRGGRGSDPQPAAQ